MDPSCLRAIAPGTTTAGRFASLCGTGLRGARADLRSLEEAGIGRRAPGGYRFAEGDRLSAALLLLERGEPAGPVSAELDWRSFEGLAARILESRGYLTERNLVLRSPRAEIDVAARAGGLALLVDCKHWMRLSPSQARRAARMQARRAGRYARARAERAVPAVVALEPDSKFEGRVPVVPIAQLGQFAEQLPGRLDEVLCVSPDQDGG